MASASYNPPPPPPLLPGNNEVSVNDAILVNAIPVHVETPTPVAATSSFTPAKDILHSISENLTNSNYLL